MKLTRFFAILCAVATLGFVGCEGGEDDTNDIKPTGNTTLTADKYAAAIGEPITFTVTDENGLDVTSVSKIHDKTNGYVEVSNPYTPAADGQYEFYAVCGSSITKTITVSVVPSIPELPVDDEPANTSFNHRILLVDHTGTKCPNCPAMMTAIKTVEEDENYHNKFYEAMAHTYNSDDPSYSRAADAVKSHFNSYIKGYPTLNFNFYHYKALVGGNTSASDIKSVIDELWKAEGADAGISAAASGGNTMVVVTASVKAKVTGDYRITAWLLEDNIYAKQAGAFAEWQNTHNNSIRHLATSDPITGFDLGTIEAGKSATREMTLEIQSSKWVAENLKVMVIATALGENNRYDIVNVAMCPVNGEVKYDYKK